MENTNNINKKIFILLFICAINISLFASENYYWDFSHTIPSTYDLQEISVKDLNYTNSSYIDSGTKKYNGYYMGQVVVDFNKSDYPQYLDLVKNKVKNLSLNQEHIYYYPFNSYIYGGRTIVYDSSGNKSTISGFVKITKENKYGSIVDMDWYDISNSSTTAYYNADILRNIKTDKLIFDYYFIVNHMSDLTPDEQWFLYVPEKTGEWTSATLRLRLISAWDIVGFDTISNQFPSRIYYFYNPVYANWGIFPAGNTPVGSDVYSLNVDIQKKFNESTSDFFDGQKHDYYSLNFDSYKYEQLTEDPFSLCIEISSANNWHVHLDNQTNPKKDEKIQYKLFLKYKESNSYSTMEIKNNQDKILFKNIKSSNSSSIIYLVTECDNARPDKNAKGTYQDTVYINFITDGWNNGEENSFAEKIITLNN